MTDDFGRSLSASVGFHVVVVLLLFTRLFFASDTPIEIRKAIRVDVVDLPDKVMDLPPPVAEPAPAKTAQPSPTSAKLQEKLPTKEMPKPSAEQPKIDLKKQKADLAKSQKKALEQLKAMQALDNIKNEVNQEKQRAATQLIKGAALSKGSALTGLEKIDYDRYYDVMESHLRQNWSLPQWLSEANLKAQALVTIDENGNVTRKQIVKSSGNSIFDSTVLEAIEKSSPFPIPPASLRGKLANGGVIFGFPEQ